MKSKILKKDHQDIIQLHTAMTPQERLESFVHHCRLVHKIYSAGADHRKKILKSASHRKPN